MVDVIHSSKGPSLKSWRLAYRANYQARKLAMRRIKLALGVRGVRILIGINGNVERWRGRLGLKDAVIYG
jgi:hypothetical protein